MADRNLALISVSISAFGDYLTEGVHTYTESRGDNASPWYMQQLIATSCASCFDFISSLSFPIVPLNFQPL